MGQCHAKTEDTPVFPTRPRRVTSHRSLTSHCTRPYQLGPQPSPILVGLTLRDSVDRELSQAYSLDSEESLTPVSSSSIENHYCSCPVNPGDKVELSSAYETCEDASEGNLVKGEVGLVTSVDLKSDLYCVNSESGDSWWFTTAAIRLQTCTSLCQGNVRMGQEQKCLRQACHDSIDVARLACARWNRRVTLLSTQPG